MQRTVQYWRLVKPDGTPLDGTFPASLVLRELREAQRKGLDRHRFCRDGMVLIGHGVAARPDQRSMLILDKVRRENLPSVGDRGGVRRSLGLGSDEGLLEPTYCAFADKNVVAMLTSGNGPRAKRLCDYLKAKLDIEIGLDPVLTKDLDRVLNDMRISSIDIAVPASRVNRNLVGGDWAGALEANRVLVQDGIIRVGVSVGRSGSRDAKIIRSRRIRDLISQLRGSGAISELQTARVSGTIGGTPRSVDLLSDHFVEKTDVDADRLTDPDQSATYARQLLEASLQRSSEYLTEVVPSVTAEVVDTRPSFIEAPADEQLQP